MDGIDYGDKERAMDNKVTIRVSPEDGEQVIY